MNMGWQAPAVPSMLRASMAKFVSRLILSLLRVKLWWQ
jgi:hypothetical protein